MTLYGPAWQKWLDHKDNCGDCSSASIRPRIGKLFSAYCDIGITLLQRLEEIAREEDDL